MGYKLMDQAFSRVLSPTEKAVLCAMAHKADDRTGLSWLSRETVAEMTGMTTRSVTNMWKSLQESGVIEEVAPSEWPWENMQTRVWRLLLEPTEEASAA